jgi:hypothetical protein
MGCAYSPDETQAYPRCVTPLRQRSEDFLTERVPTLTLMVRIAALLPGLLLCARSREVAKG